MTIETLHRPDDAPRLVGAINDPKRTRPIVAVTQDRDGRMHFSPRILEERLAERVVIYRLSFQAAYGFTDAVGKELSVFAGAARVYPARFDLRDSPRAARLYFPGAVPGETAATRTELEEHVLALIGVRASRGPQPAPSPATVERTAASDKASFPLPEYTVAARFTESLAAFTREQQGKALKAAVDVLTGRAKDVKGRRLHALRFDDGPASAPRRRADGAVAYRVNVETGTPSARRLHYWKQPDGRIELSSLGIHDDFAA